MFSLTKHTINILVFILSVALASVFLWQHPFYPIVLGALSVVFLLILSFGILFLKFQYFLPAINRLPTQRVLLTFDDGPNPQTTPQILEILSQNKLHAVFFVIGKKAEQHPELVQAILAGGHVIGNHTYAHSNFFSLQWQSTVERDIAQCDAVVKEIALRTPELFRPPIGYTNPRIARALRKMKKQTIGWRLRSYDSVLKNPEKLLKRLTRSVRPGDIILLHDNLPQTANCLSDFIRAATKNGIIFASMEDIQALSR